MLKPNAKLYHKDIYLPQELINQAIYQQQNTTNFVFTKHLIERIECELRTTLKSGGFLFSLQRFDLKIQMRLSHSNFKRSISQRRSVPDTRCF